MILQTLEQQIIKTAKEALATTEGITSVHLVSWRLVDVQHKRLIASVQLNTQPHAQGDSYDVWVCCDFGTNEIWSI